MFWTCGVNGLHQHARARTLRHRFSLEAGLVWPSAIPDSSGPSRLKSRIHPSRELLVGYATGTLPLGPSLTLAVHLECCGACRHVVLRLEEVEGRLLASTPGVALQPDALQRALKQIDTPPAFSGHVKGIDAAVEECSLPRMISEIGLSPAVHLSADTWVAHLDAPRFGGWRTYVLCAPALAAVPAHGHFGDELIAVLEGSFHDSREFGPGDFVENRAGFVHEMQIASAGRLVALISSHGAIDWRPRDRALGALLDI